MPKKRHFRGDRQGERLAAWLNADNVGIEREISPARITMLIEKLKAYLRQHDAFVQRGPYGAEDPDEMAGVIGEYIRTAFNPGLAPVYSPLEFGQNPKLQLVPRGNQQITKKVMESWRAFQDVCALFDMGRLLSLCACEWCGEWMFAKLPDNRERMHKACKKLWLKERMREYMRCKRADPNFDGAGFFEI